MGHTMEMASAFVLPTGNAPARYGGKQQAAATSQPSSAGEPAAMMPEVSPWSKQVVEQLAASKDGEAMRSTVEMLAKSQSKYDEFCFGLPGNIPPANNYDPLKFSSYKTKEQMLQFREAELTHGRVSMLASLGFLVQENYHPFFSGTNGVHWEIIPKAPNVVWFGIALGAGICEAARIQAMKEPGYIPGDIGFDPLGIRPTDPKEFRKMQERELSHGRLAMLAAAGFIIQEAVTGTTWGPTWADVVAPYSQDLYG